MALPNKEEVKAKLLDYPLLRQLVCERWFRLAFLAFLLVFVFLGLFLPRIWRASRPGFLPVIRVSGLDLVQAWSLRRTAIKATAAGRFDEANYAWQAALANNRADAGASREALRSFLLDPHAKQRSSQGVAEAYWLLKLSGTNQVDAELAAQVFERCKYYEPILDLAQLRTGQISPGLASAYLKALFSLGKIDTFRARWDELGPKAANDPEIPLYRAAFLVGWGPPETIAAARQQLDVAGEDPKFRILAYQLKSAIAVKEMNPVAYGEVLKKLADWREDTLSYHARYWRLLIQTGHKDEAVRLVQAYPVGPVTPMELVELVDVYARLDQRTQGIQLLQRYQEQFAGAPIYWVTYANELSETKRWEDLRSLALQMRAQDSVRDQLGGFSYFLEGRSEIGLGRSSTAASAFQKAAQREFPFAGLGQRVASQLLQFGYPELSRQILIRLEPALQDEIGYWTLVFGVADRLKDVDLLVKAAGHAHRLAPHDPVVLNNYAAALIIARARPDEAIKLTFELLTQSPESLRAVAVVNHGAALLLNDRPREAESLLKEINTNGMQRAQLTLYNLDLFETYLSLRQYDRAWRASDGIEPDFLYPTQRKWLLERRKQLPPRAKEG
jgi:predicted Zn-dependent protease